MKDGTKALIGVGMGVAVIALLASKKSGKAASLSAAPISLRKMELGDLDPDQLRGPEGLEVMGSYESCVDACSFNLPPGVIDADAYEKQCYDDCARAVAVEVVKRVGTWPRSRVHRWWSTTQGGLEREVLQASRDSYRR